MNSLLYLQGILYPFHNDIPHYYLYCLSSYEWSFPQPNSTFPCLIRSITYVSQAVESTYLPLNYIVKRYCYNF